MTAPQAPLDLSSAWLVDRSRIQRGRIGCPRARYREYHSGPTGYGIRRRAQSLPLATGSQVHKILEALLRRSNSGPVEDVRAIIRQAVDAYRSRCAKRGFLELAGQPTAEVYAGQFMDAAVRAETLRVVDEQSALIEAMGWALHLVWLPPILDEWEPVVVEQEMLLPLGGASGGAASGGATVLMQRHDAIMRRRSDGSLAQFEAKTVGGYIDAPFWRRQWEDSPQLMLAKIVAEAVLKEPVSFAYILALDKGKRSQEEASGLYKQWTPFLYPYYRPANPPMEEEEWRLSYKYVGEDGRNHTISKKHQRVESWKFDFRDKPATEISNIEWWVRKMPPEYVMAQHEILGPYDFLNHSQDSILRALRADDARWQNGLWVLHEVGEACGWNEADPRFVAALDELFPQSWNCHAYGKDCPYLPICRREPCWAAPHEDERFELRRPHHQPEIDQMIARGIEPPADQDEDEGEE